jgi:VIT1/CCC1 family predicted Fe2+/Mn2+ transporter
MEIRELLTKHGFPGDKTPIIRGSALKASQAVELGNTEQADLKRERHELATQPEAEEDELTGIYVRRGLEPALARTVAPLGTAVVVGGRALESLALPAEPNLHAGRTIGELVAFARGLRVAEGGARG